MSEQLAHQAQRIKFQKKKLQSQEEMILEQSAKIAMLLKMREKQESIDESFGIDDEKE
jgi:hypothetical protein